MTPERETELREDLEGPGPFSITTYRIATEALDAVAAQRKTLERYGDHLLLRQQRIEELESHRDRLIEALKDAVVFMKDAKRVSIRSRGIQLEAEFLSQPDVLFRERR